MSDVLLLYPGMVAQRQAQAVRARARLRERGLRLVLADDGPVASDSEFFDEVIELPPPEEVHSAWHVVERFAEQHAVAGVLAQSEAALFLGALACERFGVPGPGTRAVLACAHKYASRLGLRDAGVGVPAFELVSSAAEVRAFAARSRDGYPVVLKGVCSALGRLVTLVRGPDEVDAAVARVAAGLRVSADIARLAEFAARAGLELDCDPTRQFLVESFARGAPVETDGVVGARATRSFGVTAQVLSAPPHFYLEGYQLPAELGADDIARAERTSDAAVAAAGLARTGYSIEMRLCDGAATVIEVNPRLGWDEGFGELFEAVTGAHPLDQVLALALGGEPRVEPRPRVHAALAYTACYADAVVTRVPARTELDQLESERVRLGLAVKLGERIYAPPHPEAFPHLAWALATDAQASTAAYRRAREAVERVRVELVPVPVSVSVPVPAPAAAGSAGG